MQTMSERAHNQAMASLRAEALRRGDPESLWIARLMDHALESAGGRRNGCATEDTTDIVNIRDILAVALT